MTPFEQAFPAFVRGCADVHGLLVPWGMALLVIAFAVEFWHGPPAPGELLKFIVKLFLVVLLITKSQDLINDGQTIIHNLIENHVPARPENVAARYQDRLAEAQNAPTKDDRSFWDTLFSANWFEAIVYAVLTLVSWLAMAVLFFVYSVQRALLLLCWAVSPLLFACIAIRPVSGMGLRHVLRIVGIMLWPLGLALAATFTDGLLDAAAAQDFVGGTSVVGSLGYGLKTLLAVAVVAIWILFSSVLAPVYIQKLLTGSSGPTTVITKASDLLTDVAFPAYLGAPAAGRALRRGARAAADGATWLWDAACRPRTCPTGTETSAGSPPTVVSDPSTIPSQKDSSQSQDMEWRPTPEDPTGDRDAAATLDRFKRRQT